jgi:hypothetical protein
MNKAVLCTALVFTAVVAASTIPATPAQAQQQMLCGLRDEMGKMLVQRFGEQPQAAGLVGDRIVELLVSQTGSWTILITSADGRACVVTGGEEWTAKPTMPSKVKADVADSL